ncbi:MAG TPA: PDZ domain-containing protein, partial [Bacteroidetes bacterium]|nr:PDZ domain-containing protein [Bacteroidota bacterium]
QAGVQIGDVITAFNGKELVDYFALKYFVREAKPGDEVILDIIRGEKKVRIPVVASNMPYDGTILKNALITSSSPGRQQNDGPDAGISAVQRQKLEKRLREMEEQIRQIRMSLARFIDE